MRGEDMSELHKQREALAKGRRLVRIGNWLLWVTFGYLVGGTVALLVSVRLWGDSTNLTPAVIGYAVGAAGMAAFFVVSLTGRKLIGGSVNEVAAHPDPDAPETLRIGPKNRWNQIWGAVAMLG